MIEDMMIDGDEWIGFRANRTGTLQAALSDFQEHSQALVGAQDRLPGRLASKTRLTQKRPK
jgi:hypothetical protein